MKKLIPIIILFFAVSGLTQDAPKAVLIDEIGKTGCEELLARSDNLGNVLQNNPTATASVVQYANGSEKTKLDWQIPFVQRALIGRIGNNLKVTFLRGNNEKGPHVEFWLVPADILFSPANTEFLTRIPFPVDKKHRFAADDPGPCSGHLFNAFVEVLKSDPNLTGYVVNINDPKVEKARTIKYFKDLFLKNGISNRGLRIYFKKRKMPSKYFYSYTEYWLAPKKKT